MRFPIHTRFPDRCLHVLLPFGKKYYFRVLSHLRFTRRELLDEIFRPHNRKRGDTTHLLNFSVHAKVDQIALVNMPTEYSTTHYLANSSRNRSHLITLKCEWILKSQK